MMKKISLLLVLLHCLFLVNGQDTHRILVEEFSNSCCAPCASQDSYIDSLVQANSDKIVFVKYHTSWPCQNTRCPERAKYYGINTLPWAALNGVAIEGPHYKGSPVNLNQEGINQAIKSNSPVRINLSHRKSLSGDSLIISLNIKALQNLKGHNQLFIAIQENEIISGKTEGSLSETFNRLCIDMIPNVSGIILPEEIKGGDSIVFKEKWAIRNVNDPLQLCVSAWIQNSNTHKVLQAAFSEPVGPDYEDASIQAIVSPGKKFCGENLSPVVTLRNLGGKKLTSAEIQYSMNGGPIQVFSWSGDLAFLSKQNVPLPSVSFTVLPTHNQLFVSVKNPNQKTDQKPDNDYLTYQFDAAPLSGIPMQIEILTDQYPFETSWKISNSSGQVVFHGGNYTNINTVYQENINFSVNDCYTITFYDSGNDGIDGKYGNGYFKIRNQNGQLLACGGKFRTEEIIPFKIDTDLEVPDIEIVSDFTVFPNPFDNTATISIHLSKQMNLRVRVTNEMGQVLFSQDNDELPAGNHVYELNGDSWSPGIYIVKVLAGDKLITKKLTLSK